MTEQLTPPPIAAEVDLTDFSFMPLDVRRLRDSKLASSSDGEDFRCAVLLWCAAWHQLPAGSLPDDDIELANLAGYGRAVQQWRKVRDGALYGWKKFADGRLYHPVVVEKAREAWQSKLEERYRRECDRLRKENKRHLDNKENIVRMPSFDEWNSDRHAKGIPTEQANFPLDVRRNSNGRPPDSVLKGQGRDREGTGKGYLSCARTDPPELSAGTTPRDADHGTEGKPANGHAHPPPPQSEQMVRIQTLKSIHPRGTYRESEWGLAEREIGLREDEGESFGAIQAGFERYRRQCDAKGSTGTQYVMSPYKLVRERAYLEPFPLPEVRAANGGRKTFADHDRETAERLATLPGEDPGPM